MDRKCCKAWFFWSSVVGIQLQEGIPGSTLYFLNDFFKNLWLSNEKWTNSPGGQAWNAWSVG